MQQSGLVWVVVGWKNGVDVGGRKMLMGNVVFQLGEEKRGLNPVPVNDLKTHLGPTPPHLLMASHLKTHS